MEKKITAKQELLDFLKRHPNVWFHSSQLSDIFEGRLEHNTMIKWLCEYRKRGFNIESRKIPGSSSHEYRYVNYVNNIINTAAATESQLLATIKRIEQIRATYPPEHPEVTMIDRQLDELRASLQLLQCRAHPTRLTA